jgi:hypothetical protein
VPVPARRATRLGTLLTDLLTTDMDNAGCSWTPQPSATPASRPVRQPRTDLDGRDLATDQKVGTVESSRRRH